MSLLNQIGGLLIRLDVVTQPQWEEALQRAGPGADLDGTLQALGSMPAWWARSGESAEALTSYQRRVILRKANAEALAGLRPALRLNDCLVRGTLGRGGMGVVYRCWDLAHRRFVAVKRMNKDLPILRKRFQREIQAMQRLHHSSICQFLGSGTAYGSALIVMECLDGPTLRDEVERRHPIPWREVVGWALPVLDALEHAHKMGVVHRDIKPPNVILHGERGSVIPKLLDMGLAKCMETAAVGTAKGETVTRAGQLVGTFEYMPPEQWAGGDRVVPASDLYSLGGTLFYALTGQPPFGTGEMAPLCLAHTNKPPPSVRALRPDVPDMLDLLLQQLLAKAPGRRSTPSELRPRFRELLRGQDTVVVGAARVARAPAGASTNTPSPTWSDRPEMSRPNRPLTPAEKSRARDASAPPLWTFWRLLSVLWQAGTTPASPPTSVIRSDPKQEIIRLSVALGLGLQEWFLSLARPWRHPWRVLIALALLAGLLKLVGLW
jgi:serine/threonine protein kinase